MLATVQTDDERKGVTLMLSAFIRQYENSNKIQCGVLPPFMCLMGKLEPLWTNDTGIGVVDMDTLEV